MVRKQYERMSLDKIVLHLNQHYVEGLGKSNESVEVTYAEVDVGGRIVITADANNPSIRQLMRWGRQGMGGSHVPIEGI